MAIDTNCARIHEVYLEQACYGNYTCMSAGGSERGTGPTGMHCSQTVRQHCKPDSRCNGTIRQSSTSTITHN